MIKQEKRLNIYEVVKHLRMQRMKMVQTMSQYVFLYKCVYEIISKEKDWKQRFKGKLKVSCKSNTHSYFIQISRRKTYIWQK